MSGAGRRDSRKGRKEWESELWAYLSSSDGVRCPLHNSCFVRNSLKAKCFHDHRNTPYILGIYRFLDKEKLELPAEAIEVDPRCFQCGHIFTLVEMLAEKCRQQNWNGKIPVPDDIVTTDRCGIPIEVRVIPLKAHHGSVWRLEDAWLIQLNQNDTPARRRFTLYHEIFHILAHNLGNPVFKGIRGEGLNFNEVLADHFAANFLLPPENLKSSWPKIRDVEGMANAFLVPQPVMYLALKINRLLS